jgi:hypothetical protein
MTVRFCVSSPLVRALPITEIAIRSLKDPVGLPLSTLSHTDAQLTASGKFNLIRGVLPTCEYALGAIILQQAFCK